MLSLWKKDRDIFDTFFDDFNWPWIDQTSTLRTDIKETDHSYQLMVDLPGFKKEDIKVSLDNGYLTIEAERRHESEDKNSKFLRRERHYGMMKRSFYVGNMNLEDLKGEFKDGVLALEIPKNAEVKDTRKYLELK